jgi:hypothetical protein
MAAASWHSGDDGGGHNAAMQLAPRAYAEGRGDTATLVVQWGQRGWHDSAAATMVATKRATMQAWRQRQWWPRHSGGGGDSEATT